MRAGASAVPVHRWLTRLLGPRAEAPRPPAPERPTPVSRARVEAYLDAHGYHYTSDPDGHLTGSWEGNRFWFLLIGDQQEILQVKARWPRALPLAARLPVLQAVNDWNRDRVWPKVYARTEDSGLVLYAEVSVDFEHGVTRAQLHQVLSCGLGSALTFFTAFSGLAPHHDEARDEAGRPDDSPSDDDDPDDPDRPRPVAG